MLGNTLSLCHLGAIYFDVVARPCLRLEIPGIRFWRHRTKRGRTGCCGCRWGRGNRGEWVDCCSALSRWSRISTVLLRERHEAGNVKKRGNKTHDKGVVVIPVNQVRGRKLWQRFGSGSVDRHIDLKWTRARRGWV